MLKELFSLFDDKKDRNIVLGKQKMDTSFRSWITQNPNAKTNIYKTILKARKKWW